MIKLLLEHFLKTYGILLLLFIVVHQKLDNTDIDLNLFEYKFFLSGLLFVL